MAAIRQSSVEFLSWSIIAWPALATDCCDAAIEPELSTTQRMSTVCTAAVWNTSHCVAVVSPNWASAEPPPKSDRRKGLLTW